MILEKLGQKVAERKITWQQAADIFKDETGEEVSKGALRKRYSRLKKKSKKSKMVVENGLINIDEVIELTPAERLDKQKVLAKIVPDPENWDLTDYRISNWQQHTKEQKTKQLYAVKVQLKPKVEKGIDLEEAVEVAKEVFKKEIKPLNIKKVEPKGLDENKMIEFPGVELHLGKLAWEGDTGENYDHKIATTRFYKIVEELLLLQKQEKADTCFMTIGNDFFNTDTIDNATTKGTLQQNDLRWKKMFIIGLELYKTAIEYIRKEFKNVDIKLQAGNHDKMSAFYLYMALKQSYEKDDSVNFSEDLKDTQCYLWGDCAIFTNHGEGNLKRLQKSIAAEFWQEWGQSKFRELHLQHLHKEIVVDDESGLITRRTGSPSGTDAWHYEQRYIGATQKHQLYVWDKENGLQSIRYINFSPKKKPINKVLVKK